MRPLCQVILRTVEREEEREEYGEEEEEEMIEIEDEEEEEEVVPDNPEARGLGNLPVIPTLGGTQLSY